MNSPLKRFYYAASCLFIANALILINSRGAMLGMVLGGGYYLFKIYGSGKVIKYARTKALSLVLVSIVGGVYVADDSAIERFRSIFEESSVDVEVQSGATRTHYWKASIDMSKDYPLGVGFRGFNAYSDFFVPKEV
jgi:O-antigen ligase